MLQTSPSSTPPVSLAPVRSRSITVVVPTYREAENIPNLVERLRSVRESAGLDLSLLLMDDDSRDGSVEIVDGLGLPWVRVVVRTSDRGLSQAVLDGLRRADGDVLVVMDADLSHPPEKIPELLDALDTGADIVVGSRFTEGGSTDDDWGVFRWLNSRVATLLARPLASLEDPMSGFFALRRSTFERGTRYNPVGYKIGLELIVKCGASRIAEVPIHFTDRRLGNSKLTVNEQLKYLKHLRRLYVHKFGTWAHFAQFLAVGASGLVFNLAVLSLLLEFGTARQPAVASAIVLSMVWNFALNRRFSFSYARSSSVFAQFVGFVAACSLGAAVNYVCTVALWDLVQIKQVAAGVGVMAGTAFNFIGSRFVVFRMKHVKGAVQVRDGVID